MNNACLSLLDYPFLFLAHQVAPGLHAQVGRLLINPALKEMRHLAGELVIYSPSALALADAVFQRHA